MTQQSMGQNPMQNQPSPADNPIMGKLKQLKELLDMGLISQADFDQKKDEILKQL